MPTLLELDDFWTAPDEPLARHRRAKLDALAERDDLRADPGADPRADPRHDLRYVFVQADRHAFAEARGRSLVIEHVVAPRLPVVSRPSPSLGSLIDVIELHRPRAILTRVSVPMLLALRVASLRLAPRPATIGRWAEPGPSERAAWRLVHRVARRDAGFDAGFDAVLVANRAEAEAARELGFDRLVLAPLGEVEVELAQLTALVGMVGAGRRVPVGLHG